jgi:hypothetical protein
MRKRFKLSKGQSKRKFRKGVVKTHKMNMRPRPLRGGTRL